MAASAVGAVRNRISPLLYVVARRLAPGGAALASAALLTFSPAHVYYSHEARSYTLTIFLVLLSSYFFVRAVEGERRKDWILWTVFGILAFYSHYFAALVLVAQVCSLLFGKTSLATWKRAILCGLLIVVAAIPGLTYVFRASPENLHFIWMPQATPKEIWRLPSSLAAAASKFFWLSFCGLPGWLRLRERDGVTLKPSGTEC